MSHTIAYSDFEKVDVRVGRILEAKAFEKARKPAYQLRIDFGPALGVKKSSAQITDLYTPETLAGRLVLAVVNFPPRQIADFMSEVLVLGVPDAEGRIVLLQPERDAPLGARMY
ncbi:MAG: tRNA-binding protein [Saprospiraceae bacterium]|nr:tRNA-binding protein [Saprospiraceae bacterium]